MGAVAPHLALAALLLLLLLWWAVRALEWAWWAPRRLDRALRAQGLRGTSYRFLTGDVGEDARLKKQARAQPMPLSHQIIPFVSPLFHRNLQQYGKRCITWFGPIPRVTIPEPELVREVLSNKFGHFAKQRTSHLGRLLSNGLLNIEGEKWARHRRILNPAFHAEKLKRMLPAFSSCCSELISRWESSVGTDGSCELDVWPELQHFTRDVISRTAFGSSYEQGIRIFQLIEELSERVIQAFQTVFIPGYRFLPTKNNRRMKECDREIRKLLRGIITKRERAIRSSKASNDDLLGLMMVSNMQQFEENRSSGLKMTTEDVIEECKLFYLAGQETTSVLLTWTMVVLGMHPAWQDRAREEVLQVFGQNKPDFDGLSRLKIVTMILYEVLRLYPPVTFLSRRTYKTMELGGIIYPPGVILQLPVISIHHDPDIWGKDAGEFNPERFAEGISKAAANDQVAFFPFGWGPRICIGQGFALLEAKMAVSMILQRFSFGLSPSYMHAPYTIITLHPGHGAPIKLRRL